MMYEKKLLTHISMCFRGIRKTSKDDGSTGLTLNDRADA
jgi:hypothetical protein